MMINRKPNVLKGQHIIAQGNALGINAMTKIVRAIMFIKEEFSFRTKGIISYFPGNFVLQFSPKQDFCLLYFGLADGLTYPLITRGVVPGYAILPLQGEEIQKLHSDKNRNKY